MKILNRYKRLILCAIHNHSITVTTHGFATQRLCRMLKLQLIDKLNRVIQWTIYFINEVLVELSRFVNLYREFRQLYPELFLYIYNITKPKNICYKNQ